MNGSFREAFRDAVSHFHFRPGDRKEIVHNNYWFHKANEFTLNNSCVSNVKIRSRRLTILKAVTRSLNEKYYSVL